jgi:hypothetical protein
MGVARSGGASGMRAVRAQGRHIARGRARYQVPPTQAVLPAALAHVRSSRPEAVRVML